MLMTKGRDRSVYGRWGFLIGFEWWKEDITIPHTKV